MRSPKAWIPVAVALAALAAAPLAHATYDPIGAGSAKLLLDKRFTRFLAAEEIKLKATRGAKAKGGAFLLAVSGGSLDPTKGQGEIDAEGTLVFENDRKSVPLRNITLKTKHSPLIAKVGGSQLKAATSPKLSFKREGFAATFTAQKLKLSAKIVSRLNKKLRPEVPFAAGQPLGTLIAKTQPQLIAILAGGRATFAFDAAFLAKLDSRFVSLNPISPAERAGASFTLPIAAGGAIAPDASEGTLRTGGEIEALQLHGGQVFWKEQWFDLGAHSDSAEVDVEPTPSFPGKLGRVGILDLGQGTVSADPKARTITVSGAPLTLQAGAAATLNEAFSQGQAPTFAAGEAVGSLSFTAQGQ
jgi:hypothetical protein